MQFKSSLSFVNKNDFLSSNINELTNKIKDDFYEILLFII